MVRTYSRVACCAHVACTRKRSAPRTAPSAGVADVSLPPAVGGALERPPRLKPPLATPRMAARPLVCRIPISILLLLFMQGSLARPDFDRLRAGSEFLRRRAPVSRLEPLRYKEYLRQEFVTDSGPQVVHLKYDVTLAKSTRILDDMKEIQSIKCTNSSLTLTLMPDLNAGLLSREFQLGAVVAGGSEWGCLSSIVGEPATAIDFTRKVQSVSTDINLHRIVLGTTDSNPFDAFEEQDIDLWSENVVTSGNNLRSKSSSRPQADLPISNTSSTRLDLVDFSEQLGPSSVDLLEGEVFFVGSASASAATTSAPVASIIIASRGVGYTSAPSVVFSGGGGFGAKATATVSGGIITGIVLNDGGSGYRSAPTISFTGGGGYDAAASCVTGATGTTTATVTARISFAYRVQLIATFKFRIRAGTDWGVPALFEYECWINEQITLTAIARATLSTSFTATWNKPILSSHPVFALPWSIGGVGINAGLFASSKMSMYVGLSGMFQAEVGMVVSRTRKYGSRLAKPCSSVFVSVIGACVYQNTDVIDEGTSVTKEKIFDWGGKVVAVVKPSLEFSLALKCGLGLGFTNLGFELTSGLKLSLEAKFSYGLGNLKLPLVSSSQVAAFWSSFEPETCKKLHEAEATVIARLIWTGLQLSLHPFKTWPLLSERDLWIGNLFIACYDSGGVVGTTLPYEKIDQSSTSTSAVTLDDAYNNYQPPSPPPSPPAMCVFGVDCPVQPGSCAQGYTGRAIGTPCASGCAQGVSTVECQPSTCCNTNVEYPPANGEHRLAVAGESWTTQGLQVKGGAFTEVRCNVGYVLSGKNLGFQKLGTQANGYSYQFGASGTNPSDYRVWNWPDDSPSNFQACTSSASSSATASPASSTTASPSSSSTATVTCSGCSCQSCFFASSTTCARFFALMPARPSFSSVSTRASAPLGSAPVYSALGGPQGKGHVTFDRTKLQYLDVGSRNLNIATNGGLTIVAVVRFTGPAPFPAWETIIQLQSTSFVEVYLSRQSTTTNLQFVIYNGGVFVANAFTNSGELVQSTWLTIVATYRASTNECQLRVNNVVAYTGTASAAVTDKTLSAGYLGWGNNVFFNGDIAGALVVDEYLSTDATSLIADAMVQGVDLTEPPPPSSSGTISDGTSVYAHNTNCWWIIASSGGAVTLSFSSFDTESGFDVVYIDQCTSSSSCGTGGQLAKLSGKSLPSPSTYTSSTGYMKVLFTSDASAEGTGYMPAGFVASWSTTATSTTATSTSNTNTQCRFRQAIPGDGAWKLEKRDCDPISCGSYVPPLFGTVSPTGPLTYGQTVTITCNAGFELMGDNRASATPTCQAVGNFTSGKVCVEKSCGPFPAISRGTVFPASGVLSGQEVVVVCDDGYAVNGDSSIRCNRGAYQIATSPTCQRISCGVLQVVNGRSLPSTNILFGDSSQILCNTGYGLSRQRADGSMQPNCTMYGTFSPSWECVECEPGTYSSTEASACLLCPGNSTSTLRSSSVANCTCNVGFSGPNGGPCVQCGAGKYKTVTGSTDCTSCPSGSSSPVGSSAFTACTVNSGVTSTAYTTTTSPQPTTSPRQTTTAATTLTTSKSTTSTPLPLTTTAATTLTTSKSTTSTPLPLTTTAATTLTTSKSTTSTPLPLTTVVMTLTTTKSTTSTPLPLTTTATTTLSTSKATTSTPLPVPSTTPTPSTPPALDTCEGAYARFAAIDGVACPPGTLETNTGTQKTPATCGNPACETAISSINDSTLSLMKTGFTACGNLAEPQKSRAVWAEAMNYVTVMALATMCGHDASIVKVTFPALNTCDGATARYVAFMTQGCPTSGPDPSAYPATCGNDACKAAISSIDDNTLSLMKTGFTTCTPGPNSYASTASSFNYQFLIMIATNCGHPASTVKVTPPALDTCDGAYGRFLVLNNACPTGPNSATWFTATCDNTACATAISSITDVILSLMKTGFMACGNLPDSDGLKSAAVYATSVNYQYLSSIATQCGHPASTVKVTPPALNTCEGAYARIVALGNACPGWFSAPLNSPATCGNAACAMAISSIDDVTLSLMKTGFTACGNLPDSDTTGRKSLALHGNVDYWYFNTLATQCGHPASIVKLTPTGMGNGSEAPEASTNSTSGFNKGCGLANRCDMTGFWGNASFAHCNLNYTLHQLRQRESAGLPPNYRTGGLGRKIHPSIFEAWVCVDQHECIRRTSDAMDDWFCWVIDETIALPRERAPDQYVPWGHNGQLKLFRTGPHVSSEST